MHVLFLAPDTHVYNHAFLHGLKSVGARVSAIGPAPRGGLSAGAARWLDDYRTCVNLMDDQALLGAAGELGRTVALTRVMTIDEPLVEPAARLGEQLHLGGLAASTARLCRDKVAMKEHLRAHGVPCAQSTGAGSDAEVRAFAAQHGYPLIVKPIAGFGALDTHRVGSDDELTTLLARMRIGDGRRVAVEEFVEGHEGFFDTITDAHGVRHEFIAHYFPTCLEAAAARWISPQIAVTNRVDADSYRELRELGRRVVDVLDIRQSATHMEWFFGPKGLKFSEIAARPAGEKIWDMYRVANEFDVYREWALAVLGLPAEQQPNRRFAVGSIQIRPDRDGRIAAHQGLDETWRQCGPWIYEGNVPKPGTPTKSLDKGWLVNTWFRLRHTDFDELRRMMTLVGETVKATAR